MTIYYIGYGYSYVEIIKMFNETGSNIYSKKQAEMTITKANEYIFKIAAFGLIFTSVV